MKIAAMTNFEDIIRPSKTEQKEASESYRSFEALIHAITSSNPIVEIEESKEKIKVPKAALVLLSKILKAMSEGQPVSIVPIAAEFTTQAAAEFLGCSRPHLVKLLEEGQMPFTKVGRHRRIKFEDLRNYKQQMKARQREQIIQLMRLDEEAGMYGA
jgi:excisionase family DNA binding protein